MSDGRFRIRDTGRHIDAMAQYEELREAIEEWSNQHRGVNRCGHSRRSREFNTSNHLVVRSEKPMTRRYAT